MAESEDERVTRTAEATWQHETYRDLDCAFVDLSGDKLGARLEEIPPGQASSYHHFHTAEEEHVLVLAGSGELVRGTKRITIDAGDHVWFQAGEEIAHHIENNSSAPLRYFVFGERLTNDVVVYPDHDVMLVKGLGSRQFRIKELDDNR